MCFFLIIIFYYFLLHDLYIFTEVLLLYNNIVHSCKVEYKIYYSVGLYTMTLQESMSEHVSNYPLQMTWTPNIRVD